MSRPVPDSIPSVVRLLGRAPELERSVLDVLARGEALRAAAAGAWAAPPPSGPPDDPAARVARSVLDASVNALERAGGAALEGAIADFTRAVAAARAARHAFFPRRPWASDAARRALAEAQSGFVRAWEELAAEAGKRSIRALPWRLELASHVDPAAPFEAVEIAGHSLPATPAAKRAWGERCALTGEPFVVDRARDPRPRFRSLEAAHHVLSPEAHALVARARAVLDALPRESAGVAALRESFGFLFEPYLEERAHPTFARLDRLDFPSLAVGAHNLLTTWAHRPLFGARRGGGASGYSWRSYGEVRRDAYALARQWERHDVAPDARIGLLVDANAPEFYLAELSAVLSGRASVGLPTGLPDETLAALVARAGVGAIVADAASLERFRGAAFGAVRPALAARVGFGEGLAAAAGARPLAELLAAADDDGRLAGWTAPTGLSLATGVLHDDASGHAEARALGITEDAPDELFTVLFTSGSTGEPKGTLVTRRRWAEEMCTEADLWPYVGASFQPSAIAGDRGAVWRALTNGGRVGFARRGAELFHDLAAIRPTLFDVPPVVWNTLYGEYRRAIARADLGPAEAAAIRRRFRAALGGRVAFMATGGAPSDEGVRRTMESLFGVAMAEGYGTTETGFVAKNGVLLPGVEVKLIDRPELGYTAADRPLPRGELAVRTPRTTARYLAREATEGEAAGDASFTDDGFFRTGDLVELGPGRRVRIVGRAKLTFKLAGAELVTPEALERVYARSEAVEQIWVSAGSGESRSGGSGARVVAVVVPRREGADARAIGEALRRIAEDAGLRSHERVGAVVVAPRERGQSPWRVDNGLLTPSFKLDRRALAVRYRAAIAEAERELDELAEARIEVVVEEGSGGESVGEASLRALVAAVLRRPAAEIDLARSFADHGGDSLATLELAMRLEEVFGGKERLDEAMLAAPESIARLPLAELAAKLGVAEVRLAARTPAPPAAGVSVAEPVVASAPTGKVEAPRVEPVEDFRALAHADAADVPAIAAGIEPSTSPDVLLTGATGFLGVHLLDRLVRTLPPGARVFAVVRAANDAKAAERVRAALEAAELPPTAVASDPRAAGARVVALAGRLDAERFGLEEALWERLAREVGLVHHVAASVTGAGTYGDLRAANVLGTRRALELATTTTAKAFHLVSSLNVSLLAAPVGRALADESTPLPSEIGERTFRSHPAYAVTKWASERLVAGTVAAGGGRVRATISRPALLGWSRATGFANDHDWLTRVLASCLVTRSIPGPPEAAVPSWVVETETSARGIDLVPVDFAAAAIARLGELAWTARAETGGDEARLFHVSNLAPGELGLVTMPRLLDLLVSATLEVEFSERPEGPARPLAVVTPAEWRARVETEGAPALPLLDKLRQSIPSLPRTPSTRFGSAMEVPPGSSEEPLPESAIDAAALAAFVGWHRRRFPVPRGISTFASR